jgi:hypothetical protein
MIREAVALVQLAAEASIHMRIAGSVAVALWVDSTLLTRPNSIKDIDLVARRCDRKAVQMFFVKSNFSLCRELLSASEDRETFVVSDGSFTVDVYYDAIDGSHRVELAERMGVSYPCISWTDLILSKLQRHSMRMVDYWDVRELFSSGWRHFDVRYFEKIVGSDWGLYTTILDNLALLILEMPSTRACAQEFIRLSVGAQKSRRWRLRSIVGRRAIWWREVYELNVLCESGVNAR